MTNERNSQTNDGLKGDPNRRAAGSLRGYVYQIWQSVLAWLLLRDDERLYLEGAEDFDQVSATEATSVQVKYSTTPITLRSHEVLKALDNFWDIHNRNLERTLRYRFLSRASIGIERGEPFGEGVRGLILWENARQDIHAAKKLRHFLLELEGLSGQLRNFLQDAEISQLQEKLFIPIDWDTERDDIQGTVERAEELLIVHGQQQLTTIPPTRSIATLNRLLREAFETAMGKTSRPLSRADFLRFFEEETTERVPAHRIQQYELLKDLILSEAGGKHPALQILALPLIVQGVPAIRFLGAARTKLVDSFHGHLSQTPFLNLTGSSGMGKTTLARLVARSMPERTWLWVQATGLNPDRLLFMLRQLLACIQRSQAPTGAIIDDMPVTPKHFAVAGDSFSTIVFMLRTRSSVCLVTSRKPLPSMFIARTSLPFDVIFHIPPLESDEIRTMAEQYGCPVGRLSENWAKVIDLQTKGHPQLVHARIISLQQKAWPKPGYDDFLKAPPDVEQHRAETRDLLIAEVSEQQRLLLYRLSMATGSFRREVGLYLANHPTPIGGIPGEIFDSVVGPWIEHAGEDRFSLSPLLQHSADKVLDKEAQNQIHVALAQAMLRLGEMSPAEGAALFFHAFLARSEPELIAAVLGLIQAPSEILKLIAWHLSWFAHAGLEPRSPLFESNPHLNFMLRMLQLRVAHEKNSETAQQIVDAWEIEMPEAEDMASQINRFGFICLVLVHYEIDIAPGRLLRWLTDLVKLEAQINNLNEIFREWLPLQRIVGAVSSLDIVAYLFTFVIPRIKDLEFLIELIDGMGELPEMFRKRVLSAFAISENEATLFIDKAWLTETKKKTPDWAACITTFERIVVLFTEWQCLSVVAAATRAISIIHDEYLNDKDAAVLVLESARSNGIPTTLLDDQHANLLYRHGLFAEALEIWELLLPNWKPEALFADTRPVFSCRKAGICAANLGNWSDASLYFRLGREHCQAIHLSTFATGFLADSAYADWNAGEQAAALVDFSQSLQEVEVFQDPRSNPKEFAVKKFLGHILLKVSHELTGDPLQENYSMVLPGMCSDPDPNPKLHELPDAPNDMSWVLIAEIEYAARLGSVIFERIYQRLHSSPYPVARMMFVTLSIRHTLRDKNMSGLPHLISDLEQACRFTKAHHQAGLDVGEISDYSETDLPQVMLGTTPFLDALVISTTRGKIDNQLLEQWRDQSPTSIDSTTWNVWLNQSHDIIKAPYDVLVNRMRDKNSQGDVRLLAAAMISESASRSPDDLFYAHVLLFNHLSNDPWKDPVADILGESFALAWSEMVKFTAVLRSPRMTVPDITSAVRSRLHGLPKIAGIILAARHAVAVRLPEDMIQKLQMSINEKGI